MPAEENNWKEIKQEAEVIRGGRRVVKRVTLEKEKPSITTKDWLDIVLRLFGLLSIAVSVFQLGVQQCQYRKDQKRHYEESARQSEQFSEQMKATIDNSAKDRNADFKRAELEKKFQIYEPAVSEIEALLTSDLVAADFTKKLNEFRINRSPKIFLVSDSRLATLLQKLENQLVYYGIALDFKSIIDSSRDQAKIPFNVIGDEIGEQIRSGKFKGGVKSLGGFSKAAKEHITMLSESDSLLMILYNKHSKGILSEPTSLFTGLTYFTGKQNVSSKLWSDHELVTKMRGYFYQHFSEYSRDAQLFDVPNFEYQYVRWTQNQESINSDLDKLRSQLTKSKNDIRELMRQSTSAENN